MAGNKLTTRGKWDIPLRGESLEREAEHGVGVDRGRQRS